MTESVADTSSPSARADSSSSRSFLGRIWGGLTGNGSLVGYIRFFVLLIVVLYVILFIAALLLAIFNTQDAAGFFGYLRDLITIVVSLTGVLIVIGIGVILVQIARFVNLLRSEVKPITQDAQEAVKNVRTTTEFVQKQAVEPIIAGAGFLSGLVAFLREIANLSRLFRRQESHLNERRQDSDND